MEVPENMSENDLWAIEESRRISAPSAAAAFGETPSLEAGYIVSLAVQALQQWSATNENQLSLNKGDIIRVTRKYVSILSVLSFIFHVYMR